MADEIIKEEEYTDEDLISEPPSNNTITDKNIPGVIEENGVSELTKAVKDNGSMKVWVIFNTFLSVVNFALLLVLFMVTMLTPA